MATYCISDIHGRVDAFVDMLHKIDFKYDGTDRLIIMGDMVDWGDRNIETLCYCKELDKYDFVDVLMGNHDHMMLKAIVNATLEERQNIYMDMWMQNGGNSTLTEYLDLSGEQKRTLLSWLMRLKYYVDDLEVGGRKFYVTHSSPCEPIEEIDEQYHQTMFEDMIWDRVRKGDNQIRRVLGNNEKILVHGHTITGYYNSYNEDGKCEVYMDLENQRIAIDCGCKVLGIHDYGRLACIRLDDLEVFYTE